MPELTNDMRVYLAKVTTHSFNSKYALKVLLYFLSEHGFGCELHPIDNDKICKDLKMAMTPISQALNELHKYHFITLDKGTLKGGYTIAVNYPRGILTTIIN